MPNHAVSRALVVGLAALALAACCATSPLESRPLLVVFGPNRVTVQQPGVRLPLAYFDSEARRLFVDEEFVAVVAGLVGATVAESGAWSLPETAGGLLLEPEPIAEWDPTKKPRPGDWRIGNRECAMVNYQFNCLFSPRSNPKIWLKSKRFTYGQCSGSRVRPCREDFALIGPLKIYGDKACTQFVDDGEFWDWMCLEL